MVANQTSLMVVSSELLSCIKVSSKPCSFLVFTVGPFSSPEHQGHAEMHADALTMAFATLGLIQLLHAFNVKSVYQSIFKVGLFKNKTFNWSIPVAFILLMVTILVPGFNSTLPRFTLELDSMDSGCCRSTYDCGPC